ncbi:MAG TPA: SDR family oxidoreductase [Kiritimatiellia bacterium]|nr:SDR family oxidoreductase [Kiritimatiellia bacterium]HMP33856.1 SDR family oxidoreductase [Kiritimatiellia bacterium]
MSLLRGHVTLITGAGSGIGLATAHRFHREGATVVLVARSEASLDRARTHLTGPAPVLTLSLDVRKADDMGTMVNRTVEAFGRIDSFIANAGTIGHVSKEMKLPYALAHLPLEEWDLIIDTNLKGLIHGNRTVLRQMMAQGRGEVINVGSYPASLRGSAHAAAYSASKHAVRGLTQAAAEEMRPFGIRMQTLMPGPTETPMLYGNNAVSRHGALTPDDVARQILHLITLPRDATLGESVVYAVKPADPAP